MPPTRDEIKDFSVLIEKIATEKRMGHMDAVCYHCKETGLEVEIAATLISPPLKAKIKVEAEDLHLIKRSSKLPI
jgi:hypothetical protein